MNATLLPFIDPHHPSSEKSPSNCLQEKEGERERDIIIIISLVTFIGELKHWRDRRRPNIKVTIRYTTRNMYHDS